MSCCRYAGNRFRYCSYGITPTVRLSKKSPYQTASSPMITGRFRSNGVVRKCSSIAWNPANISPNACGPIASIVDRPIAESIE